MYIIADVEWVENQLHKCSPTQLSAVRVDENWEIIDDFSSYIKPLNPSFYDWDHVAYTGGSPTDFKNAPHCFDIFKSFNEWVGEDIEGFCARLTRKAWGRPSPQGYSKSLNVWLLV